MKDDYMLHEIDMVLADKLFRARKAIGFSTRTVAQRLNQIEKISHTTLANYEKAKTRPTLAVLAALANIYGRPLNWFIERGPVLSGVRYRNLKSKVTVGDRHRFEGESQKWLDAYRKLEQRLDQPLQCDSELEVDQCEVELPAAKAAEYFRKEKLGLDDGDPIISVTELLEKAGIRTIELPTTLRIDGMAARFGDEHAVVLNPSISSDRGRLNGIHELRHARARHCDENRMPDKQIEADAFEFASNILLPRTMLKAAFTGRSFVQMVKFKEQFGISLAAMVYRAEKEKIIKKSEARYLWVEFSKRGWRGEGREPGYVRPDRATRFEVMLESAINNNELSWNEIVNITGLREDELRQRLHQATGPLPPPSSNKKGGNSENKGLRLVH